MAVCMNRMPAIAQPLRQKSRVVDLHYDWLGDKPPRTPWGETVIYEAHVKGLTRLHPELPEAIRGTYQALGHPLMIDYFRRLGITALELMPVAQFASEPRLQRMGLSNYWGYKPAGAVCAGAALRQPAEAGAR